MNGTTFRYIRTFSSLFLQFSNGEHAVVDLRALDEYTRDELIDLVHQLDGQVLESEAAVDALKQALNTAARCTVFEVQAKRFRNWSAGSLELRADGIYRSDGTKLDDFLSERALHMQERGLDVRPFLRFISRLENNPSHRAVNELYGFLAYGQLPLFEDGTFAAYKRVRSDYTDVHSGTISNQPGAYVSMPRQDVDDNPNNTCSTGLHFASRDYLRHFMGERVMLLKIDPADVVSIPVDYNNTKGRCCAYTVAEELDSLDAVPETELFQVMPTAFLNTEEMEEEEEGWDPDPDPDDDDDVDDIDDEEVLDRLDSLAKDLASLRRLIHNQ